MKSNLLTVMALVGILAGNVAQASRGIVPFRSIFETEKQNWEFNFRPDGTKLVYFGGRVLSNVKVVAVFWGTQVDPETVAKIGDFYTSVTNSTYIDWLSEYNTNIKATDGRDGTNQKIARGTYGGAVTITPINQGTTLDKLDVQVEIEKQLDQGALPKPDANTLYMFYFPAGMTLMTGGQASCSAWCADHEGFVSKKYGDIAYGMMPDLGGSCAFGCGMHAKFDNLTNVSSHELIEAITDPMCPDMNVDPAFPAAWLQGQEEIGDLCVSSSATLQSRDKTYAIQGEFDNSTGACKVGQFSSP
jgi:hypothetical protein